MAETLRVWKTLRVWIAIFALPFIILGIGYSTLTPIFENSDETLHYPYIKHLADGRGLPLAIPNQLWNQEGTQPPLYYAIVAASTFWIDSDNLLDHLQYNPHWQFTEVRAMLNDNQNRVLHGEMDKFPYQRAALAIHIGRGWSLLFGLLTVIFTFLLGRFLFPNNLPLTLTATALTAFNPQFLRVSSTVSNDSLSAFLTTLTVYLALTMFKPNDLSRSETALAVSQWLKPLHSWQFPITLGLLCGLTILAKLSSATTILLVGFIILAQDAEIENRKSKIKTLLIIALTTLIITGWWFYRNYALYGEWLAAETHLNLAGRGTLSLSEIWQQRAEIQRAYWATFGWGQIRLPEWIYQALSWFSLIGFIGQASCLLRYQTGKMPVLRFKASLLILWAMLSLISYLGWVMKVGSVSHTRLMFPATAAISLLLAWGWYTILDFGFSLKPYRFLKTYKVCFSSLVITAFIVLNIYSLGWQIYPAFTAKGSLGSRVMPLDLTFLSQLKLVAGSVGTSNKPQAKSGDVVLINAQWQTIAPLDKNYSVAAVLLSPDKRVLAHRETYHGLGLRPTRYLKPSDTFFDVYPLRLTTEITEPLVAQATLTLFDMTSATRAGFPAIDATGHEITPIVGNIKIVPSRWPIYQPTHIAHVNLADALTFIGYDLSPVNSSQLLDLTLYWQSHQHVDIDYVVLVHLLDEHGQVIAGADRPPTDNAYPTSWWAPGEIIADHHHFFLPARVVKIGLGMYNLGSGERLRISESTLSQQDNSFVIGLK